MRIFTFDDLPDDPLGLMREVCNHLGIDPTFRFRPLPAQNAHPDGGSGARFLTLTQRERLASDMARLRDEYGVDTSRWGFT